MTINWKKNIDSFIAIKMVLIKYILFKEYGKLGSFIEKIVISRDLMIIFMIYAKWAAGGENG